MEEQRSSRALIISIVVVVLALAGIAVYALSTQRNTDTDRTPDTQTTTQTTPTNNDTDTTTTEETTGATITYTDDGFSPSTLTVKKGTVVTVKNDSSEDVQFSSDEHPTHTLQTELNLDVLSQGESDTFTVTKVGSWGWHNHLDESQTGTLVVTE